MTILYEDSVAFSMQHSRKAGTTHGQQHVDLSFSEEATTTHSSLDMRFGSRDENNEAASTSTSDTNILTVSTGTNTGNCKPGNSSVIKNSSTSSGNSNKGMSKKVGKRPGRKPAKIDERAKLERSRQSAKECRARKKLRYQYLEELVLNREKAVLALRDELETFKQWCMQLDAGGKIPDALLKMVANEDSSSQARQVQDAKRAAQLQQEHQRQEIQVGYPTVASASSVFKSSHQSLPQSDSEQYVSEGVSPSRLPNLSPTQPGNHFKGPPLKRQLAFDFEAAGGYINQSKYETISYQNQLQQQQQQQQLLHSAISSIGYNPTSNSRTLNFATSQQTSAVQSYSRDSYATQRTGSDVSFSQIGQTNPCALQSQQLRKVQQGIRLPLGNPLSQSGSVGKFSHTPPVSRNHSEPPMKYTHDSDSLTMSQPTHYNSPNPIVIMSTGKGQISSGQSRICLNVSQASTIAARSRSHSNPAYMTKMNQQVVSPTEGGRQVDEIISSLRARDNESTRLNKPKSYSLPNTLFPSVTSEQPCSSRNLGLFSGRPLSIVPSISSLTSSELSNAMDDTSSYSSDDNATDLPLFESSNVHPQKRAFSDPDLNRLLQDVPMKTSSTADPEMTLIQDLYSQKPFIDPLARLNDITTVHCLSSTRTSNTPSPSPFGVVPRNTDSPFSSSPAPSSSMGYPNTTPSSSNTPSPAPLSSLASSRDLLPEELAMEVGGAGPSFEQISSTAASVMCSETGLSATISEPIPEWYSFLDDLEEGGFIPKQTEPEQPVTPVNKFMNVPNFLNEVFGDDKDV